jgi:hypothetical protein
MSRMWVFSLFICAFVLFQLQASSGANRHIAKETPLVTKTLPDVPGKEGLIKPQTVHAGEVFYESPTDIHVDSRNASKTQPAKLLVFFVKKIGAPPTVAVGKAAH